jgi:hypothetical protein
MMKPLCGTKFGFCFALAILVSQWPAVAQTTNFTIKVNYRDRDFVGRPLAWDGQELMLLRRDGKINILPVESSDDFNKLSDRFKPYSSDIMRTRLQKEFGRKYQVSVTRSFVVVHPPGDYQVWAMPFEKLFARFDAYFSSRGFHVEEPEFPMVAVVLRTRREFDKFLRAYHDYDRRILGYYSPKSNRIITYDQSNGNTTNQSWFFNADTIIHEATHQTAFNTGVHNRFGPVPRWVSEGLAMLFEAKGVNNSMYYTKQKDRINRERLIDLKHYIETGKSRGQLSRLITSDRLFRTDQNLAYALAWGMTFYLSEKMPSKYHRFLREDSQRTNFQSFSSRERAAAFSQIFGSDLESLESRMEHFIAGLDVPAK